MNRKTPFAPNEYYYIYNRGIEKRPIYQQEHDYNRFLSLLYLCNTKSPVNLSRGFDPHDMKHFSHKRGETLVDVCAYCLMPNHFHILLREKQKDGKGISVFMQKISTAYTMYFNKRLARSGSLFEGAFKSRHANNDEYLKYLISYIHLNPIKLIQGDWKEVGIKDLKKGEKFLTEYRYSSYNDFNGISRPQTNILTKGSLPDYFDSPLTFKENHKEWLSFQDFQKIG